MARKSKRHQVESEEEEYEVERIVSHKIEYEGKQKKPILFYFVKWKNYASTENTWEPSESVENAEDLVDEYWVTKGGQQKRKDVFREINDFKSSKGSRPSRKASQESVSKAEKTKQKTPKSPPAKKRKAAEPDTESENESDVNSASSEDEIDYSESDIEDETFRQNSNWEDVAKVETVRTGDDRKKLYAIVRWSDGKLARYQTSFVGRKNPMALIEYYEKRLTFEKNQ